MGNTNSRGARKFLEPEPAWDDYYVAEWRSERAKELDKYGGPGRPPVARGDSVTAKLVFLEGALRDGQKRMKIVLQYQDEDSRRREQVHQKLEAERTSDFMLNTDLRALERAASAEAAAQADEPLTETPSFSLVTNSPEVRRKMMEQRKKMLEYAKGVHMMKGAKAIKPINLPAIKSKVVNNWRQGSETAQGDEYDAAADLWACAPPADWRLRVHAARRRTLLLVTAVARWQVALSRRPGPKRLPRVASFSYFIPQVLGPEAKRFIEEATLVAKLKAETTKPEEAPEDTRDPQQQQPTPERVSRTRIRRGVSDSGTPSGGRTVPSTGPVGSLTITGGGVEGDVEAAAGSSTGGPLAGGGGGSKRPELRRCSSGKQSSASLPEPMLSGLCSDADAYGPLQRIYSGQPPTTYLPAINSRASSTGEPLGLSASAPPDVPSPPLGPRQPRSKAARPSSGGQGGRTTRRGSDGALAAAVPPSIAAAAAAGAAALAAAAAGGSAAAVLTRRIGSAAGTRGSRSGSGSGMGKARASETGVVSRTVYEMNESSSGVSTGTIMAGLRQAQPGAPPLPGLKLAQVTGSISAQTTPRTGLQDGSSLPAGLLEAASGGSETSAGGGIGFLPRIASGGSSSGGGGAGDASNGSGSTKPLTMAQARRMTLLAEAANFGTGGSGGGVEECGRGSPAAMSPVRLGMGAPRLSTCGAPSSGGGASGSGGATARSPDKLPAGVGTSSYTVCTSVGASILDGAPQRPIRELRNGPALGGGPSALTGVGTPLSPSSPGMRARAISLDPSGLRSGASDLALSRGLADAPSPARRVPFPSQVGPSGFPSPSRPSPISPNLPAAASSPITAHDGIEADDQVPPLSPTESLTPPPPLPTPPPGPPPLHPPPPRPSIAASAAPPPSASVSGGSSAPTAGGKPPLPPSGTESNRSTRAGHTTATIIPVQPPCVNTGNPAAHPGGPFAAAAAEGEGADGAVSSRLQKSQQLMSMYANRVNATWAESQQWGPPEVLSVTEQEQFCASDAWVPYKVNVQRMLKAGHLAVHIDACADAVQLADGSSLDLWTSDPWVLAQRLRPGSLPLSERIEGPSLGARILCQLVLAVEALAGRDAVPRLTVILAINDDQRNAVVADILRSRSYGLKPENLILTAQRKRCGYRYDRDAQTFLEDPATPPQVLGSGYSLCQLAWLGDAFSVTPSGELTMLMGATLLERLASRRVEWLVARRARDLALLRQNGVLDMQALAFGLYAADRHSGNMVMQAAPATSLTIPRAYDSTLLSLRARSRPSSASTSASSPASTRVASVAASTVGVSGGGAAAGVVDLRSAELSSPVMVEVLTGVKRQAAQEGWVGLQRYMLHLPTLHAMLNTLGIFRPKLTMCGDVARLSLDAGDITADQRVACVAVQTRSSPAILTSPNEVDDLIPLLLAQDRSASFRDILAANNRAAVESGVAGGAADGAAGASGGGSAAVASGDGGAVVLAAKPGIRILVFVANNDVTQLAVNLVLLMARPGRDVVHLVTVVHNNLQTTTGQALVLNYLRQISAAMIEAHCEVLVKGLNGLLDVMEGAAARLAPQLVVMGSAALTLAHLNTASVMGSVTLSVLKRLTIPVAVATSNSRHLVLTQRRTALRCMVVVDPTSRPVLHFAASSCLEPLRGDKLVLAGHHPTRQMTTQQQQTQRRLIDNFADIASSHRFHSPYKLQLDGPLDKALVTAAEDEGVHLVGLQVPLGTKGVPGHVLGLIRSCRGAVLVFRDTL